MITLKNLTEQQKTQLNKLIEDLMKPYNKYAGIMCFKDEPVIFPVDSSLPKLKCQFDSGRSFAEFKIYARVDFK